MKSNDLELANLRHSAAHLLAASVLSLYPHAKNAIGPSIEHGFYQDFDFGEVKLSEDDFPKIEKKMHELVKTWTGFAKSEMTKEEALAKYPLNEYKRELIEEIAKNGKSISFYKSGDFLDLCKGGHIENPSSSLLYFTLLSIAGAYWRGNEKNKMLTRIYGTAFFTQKELDDYLTMLSQAKKRDHRKIGKELDLFVFSDLVGAGLPLFTPKGTVLREELIAFSEKLQKKHGYQKVWIPHITKVDLYKKSGHFDKFGDELFQVKSQETTDKFVLKPMNCPHHIQIYASRPRSYKELPIRYMETTVQYRDEKAGEMLGLSRVRAISIDDSHVFCSLDHVEEEFAKVLSMVKELYTALGLSYTARLSFRDESDKYLGEKKDWDHAQNAIEKIAKEEKLPYTIALGEAAFYGPKIDIMVVDALGREWQCATAQLDFIQPKRFELTYVDNDGKEKTPVMVHKALLGSIERFLSVYIEHTEGKFPLWLSPVQIILLPIAERHEIYAETIAQMCKEKGIRVSVDNRNESLRAKIRDATLQKIPLLGIIGDEETAENKIAVRERNGNDLGKLSVSDFLQKILDDIDKKV